jgi:carbonic anhydrase
MRYRTGFAMLATAAMATLSACGTSDNNQSSSTTHDMGHSAVQPAATTEADWKPVADILGRSGQLKDDNTVYRVGFPRSDLSVVTQNVTVKPGLSLGGWTVFARYPDGSAMVMGDLVLTEAEVPKVTDALQAAVLSQTALSTEFAKVPTDADATVEMTVDFLDHAAFEAIEDWLRQQESNGGSVDFVEIGAAKMAAATAGPPARGFGRAVRDDILGPWRREDNHANPVTAGVAAYHRSHAHVVRPHLDELRDQQDPDSFFLTCADSRIVPNVITNSGPGDLFTVRNVGNLIPAAGDTSVNAALVFALEQLNVRSIVVCGHSSCGAMKAIHSGAETSPGIDAWLAHAQPSLRRLRLGHPVAVAAKTAGFGEVDQLSMVNVAVQLETLHHHPIVRRAVATRGVTVSGLFFDIATARVIEITADGLAHFDDAERRNTPELV